MDYMQTIVTVSPQLAALSVGGSLAYPTLLMQQLKSNTSTIPIDMDTSTWLGSIHGLSGLPVIFMPMLMQWKGRKLGYIITCFFLLIGWILSLVATNTTILLLGESFHGLSANSLLPVSSLSLTEMLAPKHRFISMQILGLNLTLGVTLVGIMGRFLHYRTVSIIMLIPITIALIIAFFWPESPPWLAWKGDLDKCKMQFEKIRGTDAECKKEFIELIAAQRRNKANNVSQKITLVGLWKQITSRDFYVPTFHIYILLNMLYWSGGDFMIVYFIELAQKLTQSENATFYGSLVMYSILFLGAIVTNLTLRKFNNKTVLLSSTSGVIICLVCLSVITFLQTTGVVAKDSTICIYFLTCYVTCFGLGLNAVVFYVGAELMPVKHRSIGGALYIIINCGLYASSLKLSPYILMHIGMPGTFMIYLLNAVICSVIVWKYVPETKGKTLVELEEFYNQENYITRNCVYETKPINA